MGVRSGVEGFTLCFDYDGCVIKWCLVSLVSTKEVSSVPYMHVFGIFCVRGRRGTLGSGILHGNLLFGKELFSEEREGRWGGEGKVS